MRWGIETSFKKLKYALGSVQFHSKQDRFIEMEIYAHMIMFNAVSQIDAQAYVPQKNCKYQYAINFKQSCFVIQAMYIISSSTEIFKRFLFKLVITQFRSDQDEKTKEISNPNQLYIIYIV